MSLYALLKRVHVPMYYPERYKFMRYPGYFTHAMLMPAKPTLVAVLCDLSTYLYMPTYTAWGTY